MQQLPRRGRAADTRQGHCDLGQVAHPNAASTQLSGQPKTRRRVPRWAICGGRRWPPAARLGGESGALPPRLMACSGITQGHAREQRCLASRSSPILSVLPTCASIGVSPAPPWCPATFPASPHSPWVGKPPGIALRAGRRCDRGLTPHSALRRNGPSQRGWGSTSGKPQGSRRGHGGWQD